jgi:alpha-glucosidase
MRCERVVACAAATGILSMLVIGAAQAQPAAGPLEVTSPGGALVVRVTPGRALTYEVTHGGHPVVPPSPIGLVLADGRTLGAPAVVARSVVRSVDETLRPVLRVKRAEVRDRFNERRIDFQGGYALIVRAYDDGVAWRFATSLPAEITVRNEEATFRFTADHQLWFPEEESLISHQERLYKRISLSAVTGARFCSLPMLVDTGAGLKIAITEADLFDYPGMDLAGAGPNALKGSFPAYPLKLDLKNDRDEHVAARADYIAKTKGTREFPWRVLVMAERDATLIESDIVYRLAAETRLDDTSWIRPGKVAWDWWNALNVYGVPFRSGVNTETYKHFIDFAAEQGLEYVILDEGWYKLGDLTAVVPDIDMEAIAAHAKDRNVGLIMWVIWKTFDDQMDAALNLFQKWGVKGIKVDFMQREDQPMVNFYERVARRAAERRLLVDFHGAYKPTGLYRTYPNVITSEGVVGLEHSKWSADASPDNAVTFPFMRMLAGPVDYTPGAMLNATKEDFKPIFNRPMSQGTRSHQLAMYVAFESPLQMLSDSPSNYRAAPESLAFIAKVPSVWDETRVLAASVGESIVIARRSGDTWYIGGLTNWTPRDVDVDLSFLGPGRFELELHRDGPNSHRAAVDYVRETTPVTADERLRIHLAPGGGFAGRIEPSR